MSVHRLLVRCLPLLLAAAPAFARSAPPVQAVLFTHIEDNTPAGTLGSAPSRIAYTSMRNALVAMGRLAAQQQVPWSLQPDWKMLQAALLYEDSTLRATTNGKNFLRYLREDLGVFVDPHSHENFGYDYTDVAHLLDSLGVGGSTVIGGHIWDPSLPQFQEWDRFRVPQPGEHFPAALWRGDILMGSGTPNHVNDPHVSGVWRPRDRDHYFEHDSTANIVAVGQCYGQLSDVPALAALYRNGTVPADVMLTTHLHLLPGTISKPGGLVTVADSVLAPLVAWRNAGLVTLTDFTSLVNTWRTAFGGRGYLLDATTLAGTPPGVAPTPLAALSPVAPQPLAGRAMVRFTLGSPARVRVVLFDLAGRAVATLAEGERAAGTHAAPLDARALPGGVYFCRLEAFAGGGPAVAATRRVVVLH